MAIHHDKTVYGKLASSREDVSEERLLEMAKLLSENAEETTADGDPAKNKKTKKQGIGAFPENTAQTDN